MSNCGNCRNKTCSCLFMGDNSSTQVLGTGSSYKPFQVRPAGLAYRPISSVRRTSSQLISLNTDTAVIFQASDIPFSSQATDMWKVATPTRLTMPFNGLYLVGGYFAIYNPGGGTDLRLSVAKNGNFAAPLVKRTVTHQVGGYGLIVSVMTLDRFVATDYIELYVRSSTNIGSATNIAGAAPGTSLNNHPYFWANYVGGY